MSWETEGSLRDGCAAPHWTRKVHPMAGCRTASLTFSHTSPVAGVEGSQDSVWHVMWSHCVLSCLGCLGGLVLVLCSASELHSNQLTVTLGVSRKSRDRASVSGRRGTNAEKHCEDPVAPCRVCSGVPYSTGGKGKRLMCETKSRPDLPGISGTHF